MTTTIPRRPQALARKAVFRTGIPSTSAAPQASRATVLEVTEVARPRSPRDDLRVEKKLPAYERPSSAGPMHPSFSDDIHGALPAERHNSPDAVSQPCTPSNCLSGLGRRSKLLRGILVP